MESVDWVHEGKKERKRKRKVKKKKAKSKKTGAKKKKRKKEKKKKSARIMKALRGIKGAGCHGHVFRDSVGCGRWIKESEDQDRGQPFFDSLLIHFFSTSQPTAFVATWQRGKLNATGDLR